MKSFIAILLLAVAALGHPSVDKETFIVGGQDATPHQAPYMVSVQVDRANNGTFRHTCGGSILAPNWILTAAHCITENQPLVAPLTIVAGEHNFAETSGQEQRLMVSIMRIHQDYEGGASPFDIAMLGLIVFLTMVPGVVEPIALPEAGAIPTGDVQLFGWGSISTTEDPIIPDILQTVHKDLIPYAMCFELLNGKFPGGHPLHPSNLCTGPLANEVTACSGDSGGPIIQLGPGNVPVVVGVASWISAFPCGAINAVTVYVRTSYFNAWILEWL